MSTKMLKYKLILLLLVVRMTEQNVISTVQGRIRGIVHEGYVSYLGIPYANSTGRFKKAGLAPIWSGIRESHEPYCSAVSDVNDCLQLDVHVPSFGTGDWPVLAWVTGGPGHYNTRLLVQEGLIAVVVHHRIGPQGFLCLGEVEIPGNAAAKDVVLALRWIRDNIVAFNGSPAKVVLAGQSMGAAIVEAILLSSMGHGLYHGAILQSGSVLSPWAFNYNANERALTLSDMFFESDNATNALLNADVDELLDKSEKLAVPYMPFGLCVEKLFKKEEVLIGEAPHSLLSNRKFEQVPLMMGYDTNEAYVFTSILRESRVMKTMSNEMSIVLPEELKFLNDRERRQVARQIEDAYFKNNLNMKSLLMYYRDAYFVNHIHRSVRLHASSQPVYYYQFSYSSDMGVQEEPGSGKTGAAHSDELAFLFSDRNLDGDDLTVQRHLVKLWTNFVKYQNPTYKEATTWNTVDIDNIRLLDIGVELQMMEYPNARNTHLWDDIYDKFYYSRYRN